MNEIFTELRSIHPILPEMLRYGILVVFGIFAWLVISIPAYWALRSLDTPLTTFANFLSRKRYEVIQQVPALISSSPSPTERFVTTHHVFFSYVIDNYRSYLEFRAIRASITTASARFPRLESHFDEQKREIGKTRTALAQLEWPQPIEPPSARDFSLVQRVRNDAWLQAITFTVFAIILILIIINTLMLKEFFASFVPPIRILTIPVPIILACLFSILEMAFGAVLAFIEGSSASAILGRGMTRLGQPDGISPSRMAEMLEVDKAGPKMRC
jgi:hypothetical protein